jgi:NDP-sugar pyrophosphorylase family protein
MRPLTDTVPKPLLPFMDRPFLHHVLDHLGRYGVEEAICSSPYLESAFRSFLGERTNAPRVTWIAEEVPLGTGGAIAGARGLLPETFLVLNGDVLTDLDLGALVARHRERGAVATIASIRVPDARPYGLVETGPQDRVRAFREKPQEPIPGTVNAGTYVLEPEVLDDVAGLAPVSIERDTFPALIRSGRSVFSFRWDGYWRDLGTPRAYLEAHADALMGRIGPAGPRPLIGAGASVDPRATIGELVVVGAGSSVGPGAKIEGSVLHPGTRVDPDASVVGSILGEGVRVGAGASVVSSILGRGAEVPPGASLEAVRLPAG